VVGTQDEANAVLSRLAGGAVFEDLAKASSLDDQTRDSGGDLGLVAASQLDAGYAKQAFAAPQNGVFGPVQTQYGWNIGRVVSITPGVLAQFDSVQAQLKQELIDEKAMDRWRGWLGQQIRDAAVRYADDYRPRDPDAPPPAAPTGDPGLPGAAPAAGQPGN
jgi:peptidyl-prolyl cis-trans isomerase C